MAISFSNRQGSSIVISEFDIIQRFFQREYSVPGVVLGIGDDAALLAPEAGASLAVAVDTLVAGRHFPEQTDAVSIGHKALAVNLSDLGDGRATQVGHTGADDPGSR